MVVGAVRVGRCKCDGSVESMKAWEYGLRVPVQTISLRAVLPVGVEGRLVLERAKGCLQSGDPGSGVAEFKVNSGYFRTHGKREKKVCLSVCA